MYLAGAGKSLTVPGKNLRVKFTRTLERKDLSGQGSGTDVANAGNKPAELAVSLQLPIEDQDKLTELAGLAILLTDTGDPVAFEIVDDLANALKITRVIFCGTLSAQESDNVRSFDVSFKLQEYDSVSARREANRQLTEAKKAEEGEITISGDTAAVNRQIAEAL